MYNYIFQVSEKPILEHEWVSDSIFRNRPSLLPVADGIYLTKNRDAAIRALSKWLERKQLGTLTGASFTVDTETADRYLESRFNEFQKTVAALQVLNEMQFDNDSRRIEKLINDLGGAFSDPHCTYMLLDEDEPPISMDEFIRTAKSNTCYYIGGVLDYHL